MLFIFMLCLCLFHFFICIMHSAFNLFVFPNYMFTSLLLFFVCVFLNIFYERAMSSLEKYHLKITIIIIIITKEILR